MYKLYRMTLEATVHIDHHRNDNKQPVVFTVYALFMHVCRTMMILNTMRQKAYVTWNIVLGILYFARCIYFTLCLHASDEISGSNVVLLLKDCFLVKTAYYGSVWQNFQKPVSTWIFAQWLYNISSYKSENVFNCKNICYCYTYSA